MRGFLLLRRLINSFCSQPLKRRTATRRHDDDYDLWNDTTAVLAAPPTNAVRAASMDVDEVPVSPIVVIVCSTAR